MGASEAGLGSWRPCGLRLGFIGLISLGLVVLGKKKQMELLRGPACGVFRGF